VAASFWTSKNFLERSLQEVFLNVNFFKYSNISNSPVGYTNMSSEKKMQKIPKMQNTKNKTTISLEKGYH
jgi:hypothetical protein